MSMIERVVKSRGQSSKTVLVDGKSEETSGHIFGTLPG